MKRELRVTSPANTGGGPRNTTIFKSDRVREKSDHEKGPAQKDNISVGADSHSSSGQKRRALGAEANKLGHIKDEITVSAHAGQQTKGLRQIKVHE